MEDKPIANETDASEGRSDTMSRISALLTSDELSADELFQLARDKSQDSRKVLFQTVRDLFLDDDKLLSDRERALMGEILRQLVHDVEMDVRARLAKALSTRSDTPHGLIVELANDSFEVAHPVLLECDVLQDEDLIEIIRHRTMQHQLAVSMRKNISEAVSHALVDTGEEDVITSLLNNHGATISREVMDYLVSESKRVDSYQNPLVRRPDMPRDLAQRMYWWVSAALRKHIADNFDIDIESLDEAIETATRENLEIQQSEPARNSKPKELVERLSKLNELDAEFLVRSLRQGEISLFEAGICKISGLRPKLLRRIMFEPGGEALALLCRAIGVERKMFIEIFELTRRAKDGETEDVGEQKQSLLALYEKTRQGDAERVLMRWRRSADYLYALKQVGGDG